MQLGPLHDFADHGGDAPGQRRPDRGQVFASHDHRPAVDADQPRCRLRVRRRHVNDGVQAPRPQHCAVDVVRVVAGQDHHDFGPLGLDTVDRIQDRVQLMGPLLAAHFPIYVLAEDYGRLVLAGKADRLAQAPRVLNGHVGPVSFGGLLGGHIADQRLAAAIGTLQKNAALQRDAGRSAGVRIAERGEDGRIDLPLQVFAKDHLGRVHASRVDERRRVVKVDIAVRHGQVDRLPAVDALVLHDIARHVREQLDLVHAVLLDRAPDGKNKTSIQDGPFRRQATLDAGNTERAPDHLSCLVHAHGQRDNRRRSRAEKAWRRHGLRPAVTPPHGNGEGVGSLQRKRIHDFRHAHVRIHVRFEKRQMFARFLYGHLLGIVRQNHLGSAPGQAVLQVVLGPLAHGRVARLFLGGGDGGGGGGAGGGDSSFDALCGIRHGRSPLFGFPARAKHRQGRASSRPLGAMLARSPGFPSIPAAHCCKDTGHNPAAYRC